MYIVQILPTQRQIQSQQDSQRKNVKSLQTCSTRASLTAFDSSTRTRLEHTPTGRTWAMLGQKMSAGEIFDHTFIHLSV